jgi:phosphoserine phosphatase
MKIAFFDFDGTLLNDETIELIVKDYPAIHSKVKELNQLGIQGLVDFGRLYIEKIQLLTGLPYDDILKRMNLKQTYFTGASELIRNLKNNGYCVIVMSGGFSPALETAQKVLGFDTYFGNDFMVDSDDKLTGYIRGPCMHQNSKGELIDRILSITGVNKRDCIGVGDGRNDISMFERVGFSVAFCAKSQQLREIASVCVDDPDLGIVWDKIVEYDRIN